MSVLVTVELAFLLCTQSSPLFVWGFLVLCCLVRWGVGLLGSGQIWRVAASSLDVVANVQTIASVGRVAWRRGFNCTQPVLMCRPCALSKSHTLDHFCCAVFLILSSDQVASSAHVLDNRCGRFLVTPAFLRGGGSSSLLFCAASS